MSLEQLTRTAVLSAIEEYDHIGRDAFLSKYGFRKATTFLLLHGRRVYDAKAVVGAAYRFLPSRRRPLTWNEFASRKNTTKQWLEELDFTVVPKENNSYALRASKRLQVGAVYARAQLRRILATADATIMTGVFRPSGFQSVFLFVTEKKTADRTPFKDSLKGDVLRWQGQLSGRTDDLITDHAQRNLELLVFYRRERYEYPKAGFRYEGVFRYVSKRGSNPTSFVLSRVSARDPVDNATAAAERRGAFDPKGQVDARRRTLGTIVLRRGQAQFRATLLRAYRGRCAITGCDYQEALEAAHIFPFKGDRTHHITNGLLLRSDIHTLFDLGWIAVDPDTYKVIIHPTLASTTYRTLSKKSVKVPFNPSQRPSNHALRWHAKNSRAYGALGKTISSLRSR